MRCHISCSIGCSTGPGPVNVRKGGRYILDHAINQLLGSSRTEPLILQKAEMLRLLWSKEGFREVAFPAAAVISAIPRPSNGRLLATTAPRGLLFSGGEVQFSSTPGFQLRRFDAVWGVSTEARPVSGTSATVAGGLGLGSSALSASLTGLSGWDKASGSPVLEVVKICSMFGVFDGGGQRVVVRGMMGHLSLSAVTVPAKEAGTPLLGVASMRAVNGLGQAPVGTSPVEEAWRSCDGQGMIASVLVKAGGDRSVPARVWGDSGFGPGSTLKLKISQFLELGLIFGPNFNLT